jgi:hypothetical protein
MFFLFAGDDYYPSGGMYDFRGAFETLDAAKAALPECRDWAHVATLADGKLSIVAEWTAKKSEWVVVEGQ